VNGKGGGPAFPNLDCNSYGLTAIQGGMSLRDYFAGQSLQAVVAEYVLRNPGIGTDHLPRNCAAHAYRIADAMLAERIA
jgi:hypothetical protein